MQSLAQYGLAARVVLLRNTRPFRTLVHRPALPRIESPGQRAVDDLNTSGAHITSLRELGMEGDRQIFSQALKLLDSVQFSSDRKGFIGSPPKSLLIENPDIYGWGLKHLLLDIIESYIELPIHYRGVACRLDIADGQLSETRLFHKDAEDSRIVKIIVYLDDVSSEDGPFEYIPRDIGPTKHDLGERYFQRVSDEIMERFVPRSDWVAATGPAGTVVFADTRNVWHRGRLPLNKGRKSCFYSYNSARPLRPDYCGPFEDSPVYRDLLEFDKRQERVAVY